MSKRFRIFTSSILSIVGASLLAIYFVGSSSKEITRAEFENHLLQGSVFEAEVTPTKYVGIYDVAGTFKTKNGKAPFSVTTHLDEWQLKNLFNRPGVKIAVPERGVRAFLLQIIPTLLIVGLVIGIIWFQMNVGRSRKHHKVKDRPDVKFADIAGIDEAKAEVQEIVDFLKDPKRYRKFGAKLPKGVLLVGPPGTGKTMLAKAIAGEADAHFFSAHGSDFNEVFVGVGAKRIRDLFKQANKHRPAIIFIDEIDCLARNRKAEQHGEMQQTNNALLAAMDGFEGNEGIVVIAATNRPEDLDDALLRPGRFDRKVHVGLPDRKGRRAILSIHANGKPIEDREHLLDELAITTSEMSGADLASVLNEAAISCALRKEPEITWHHLEEARDKVRWGKERKSMVLRKEEREMVAYHEAGHTIINLRKSLLPPLYKVSIIPRGGALGTTTLMPNEDQNIHSKMFLLEHMAVLMGGRAAERAFYGATTNGAAGDLDSAKKIARQMIHTWGMGERLYYEADANLAEQEINRLLESADKEAQQIIEKERDNTHRLAQALLVHETLTREQVLDLLETGRHPIKESRLVLN